MASPPIFPGLRRSNAVHETLAREIGKTIVSGQLLPGEPLVAEERYSAETGVSRTAYREAIRLLAGKGLVYSRTKSGTRVNAQAYWSMLDLDVIAWIFETGVSRKFIQDFFELRMAVEPYAAYLAAMRRSASDVAAMGHALQEMRKLGLRNADGRAEDRAFHNLILVSTRNATLISISASIAAVIDWTTQLSREERGVDRDPMPDHDCVFEAIVQQDGDRARDAMHALILNASRDAGIV